ncbi:MAG: SAM-dependent methyltransferase [Bdellovibrionota bacterium]
MNLWAALAPPGFAHEFERELAFLGLKPRERFEDFFLFDGEPRALAWAAVTWKTVQRVEAPSISQAARNLKPLAKKWEHLPLLHRRRASLILESLRAYRAAEVNFPAALTLPEGTGAFTMLNENEILWCRDFDRPDPLGRVPFKEDRESAPSRAYLKLWEAFCLLGEWPQEGEFTLDLGSSPGGWTWVLASLGARVLSVDRSPLTPEIGAMPGVEFRKGDAFGLKPATLGEKAKWLCCDVICTPERLLGLVQEWIEAGRAERFVCTLKFQGEANPATVAEFQKLGRVVHLHHNKHELTFLR